jgi:hypothetical protein
MAVTIGAATIGALVVESRDSDDHDDATSAIATD